MKIKKRAVDFDYKESGNTMNIELITKTEAFLKTTFAESDYLKSNPDEASYRLEHSYRVANIAKTIAEAEEYNVTYAVIAGLLHDIAYCEEMPDRETRMNHGRRSAAIARPFLESLCMESEDINDICYGIAIHVDDVADFEWQRTFFSEIVGDADNIDRFDAYRIYETLESIGFSKMSLEEKREEVNRVLDRLCKLKEMKLGSATAIKIWLERLEYYRGFYEKLRTQFELSDGVICDGN
ncbi:MAG: HD domain-containing protein [Oscillospiraceae bacterium]|nr:HD domain-containing protein [Oscillospiraceae bacterium]